MTRPPVSNPGRRQAVLAAARALFAERGYRATTVRDIADASGVLSGSLYLYFDSKETLIDEVLSSYLDELVVTYRRVVAAGGDAGTQLRGLVKAAFAAFDQHRAAGVVLLHERHSLTQLPRFAHLAEREAEIECLWSGVIRQAQERGDLRADVDAKAAYRYVRDGICSAGPALTADQFLGLLLDGLKR